MTTPLFPADNGRIMIKQGPVGDCYLLATLDCLLNTTDGGYDIVKSWFTPVHNGVEVRLFFTDSSPNLTLANLGDKYGYRFDMERQQDIFFLSQERLDEIDRTKGSVTTNALAIKILERLIPYYFTSEWEPIPTASAASATGLTRSISIDAHKAGPVFGSTESKFLSSLFGIKALDCSDVNQIIQIKQLFPHQPIYISINYRKKDLHGKEHVRHALRIDRITPDSRPGSGGFCFVMVNPWNNQTHETMTCEELKQKQCKFSIYQTNQKQFEWISLLLQYGEMLNTLEQIKSKNSVFDLRDIDYCLFLFKQRVDISGIFKPLLPSHQQLLITYIAQAKSHIGIHPIAEIVAQFSKKAHEIREDSNRQIKHRQETLVLIACAKKINDYAVSFEKITSIAGLDALIRRSIEALYQLIQHDPAVMAIQSSHGLPRGTYHPIVEEALRNKRQMITAASDSQRHFLDQAVLIISNCVRDILTFPIVFERTEEEQDIDAQCLLLQNKLEILIRYYPNLENIATRFGVMIQNLNEISRAYQDQCLKINQTGSQLKERIIRYKASLHILKQTHFLDYLSSIKDQMHITEIIADLANSDLKDKFVCHLVAARNLYQRLVVVKNQFLLSTSPEEQAIAEFQSHCFNIIHEAQPVLAPLDQWGKLLPPLLSLLSNMRTPGHSQVAPLQFRFFTPSSQLSHEIQAMPGIPQVMPVGRSPFSTP